MGSMGVVMIVTSVVPVGLVGEVAGPGLLVDDDNGSLLFDGVRSVRHCYCDGDNLVVGLVWDDVDVPIEWLVVFRAAVVQFLEAAGSG